QRQLIGRRRRRAEEREGAEHREPRLVAEAARGMSREAAAEADRLPASRPRERVGHLQLAAVGVGLPRLADRERYRPGAAVGRGQVLRLPERDGIAAQVRNAPFVDETRANDRGEVRLTGDRTPRVAARHAW